MFRFKNPFNQKTMKPAPTPPAAVSPSVLPAAAPQADPPDNRIHSQLYWKRRVKFLEGLEVWTRNELITARHQEMTTLESPSAPQTRREKGKAP